jgi:hypothetical protein
MSVYKMEFQNMIFFRGVNLTIRKGPKWYERTKPGDKLYLIPPGGRATNASMVGRVVYIAYLPLGFVPESWLALEHDPDCRTVEGMAAALMLAYGEVKVDDLVTVIFFEVKA